MTNLTHHFYKLKCFVNIIKNIFKVNEVMVTNIRILHVIFKR